MKKKLINSEFAKPIGRSSLIRIDWKDWKKELPESKQSIWVILRLDKGYYILRAVYFDEFKFKSKFRRVQFVEEMLSDIYLGSRDAKRLIAWGKMEFVIPLNKDCPVCKKLGCVC